MYLSDWDGFSSCLRWYFFNKTEIWPWHFSPIFTIDWWNKGNNICFFMSNLSSKGLLVYKHWPLVELKLFLKNYFYHSWFTTFCQFLLYSKVIQLHTHICIYTFFLLISSSIMFYHSWLDIVPCDIQQDLTAYPF